MITYRELKEKYRVHAITKDGEKFSSGVYKDKKSALGMHYKMAKSGNYKNVETKKSQ